MSHVGGTGSPVTALVLAEEVWGSSLHVVRSLGRAGVPVDVATAGFGAHIYGRSRHTRRAKDFEANEPTAFCRAAVRWTAERLEGDERSVVIPMSDRLVDGLDQIRGGVDPRFELSLPSTDVLQPLLNKESSLRIAQAAGLSVPRWTVARAGEARSHIEELRMPVAIRPTAWSTVGSRPVKIAVFDDRGALSAALQEQTEAGAELLVQEYLDVPEHALEVAMVWRSRDGTMTAISTGRKRRHSAPAGGVMVWGETTDNADVAEAARQYLDRSGFTGLGGIEFIRSERQLHFVEFNPRLEAFHFLAKRAGIDTVVFEWDQLATGRLPDDVGPQKRASVWVGHAWLTRLRNEPVNRFDVLLDWFRSRRYRRRIRAVWTWDDPGPGLAAVGALLGRRAKRARVRP